LPVLLSCLLDQLAKSQEFAVQTLALLAFLLLLLKLIHIVELT